MTIIRTLGNICLVLLTALAVLVGIAFVYYHFFVDDITIGVDNIDNQVGLDIQEVLNSDELTEDEKDALKERYFLEANYYSNEKHNGIQLQELKLNYFTSYNLLSVDYRSTGMQYLGDYHGLPLDTWDQKYDLKFANPFGTSDRYYGTSDAAVKIANTYVDTSFNYYDFTNDISWNGITNENGNIATLLNRSTQFIIKIDDRAFAIGLDKYMDKDVGDVRNILGIGWKVGDKYNRYYYTYGSLFESCMQAIKTNSAGYGDYYITVDLSSLFSIREYDMETGKFKADDVSDVIKTYSVLKFHYDENGARNSTQSLFGIIDNNPNYDLVPGSVDTTYWQERMTYNLDLSSKLNGKDMFEFRYSEVYDGYFVFMSMDAKKLFADMPRAKVNIALDTAYKDKTIVGLDYSAFENVELDTLTLTSKTDMQFFLLDYCLTNTKLQTLQRSSCITLDIAEHAVSTEYMEVIL